MQQPANTENYVLVTLDNNAQHSSGFIAYNFVADSFLFY
jgi:hypothetical protein